MPTKSPAKPQPRTPRKAERPTEPAPEPLSLKAERIQELLAQHPSWRLRGNNRTLAREYGFPGRASAVAFLHFLAALTADLGRPFRVEWSGGDSVTVLLPHRAADRLVEADLALVRQLEEPR